MKLLTLFTLPGLLLLAGLACAGEKGGNLVERYFENLESLEADFYQRVDNGEQGMMQESTGHVWIQRPGRFRWDYQHPYQQELIADGSNLWTHDPDLEQVTVKPASEVLTDSPAMLLSGQKKVSSIFAITSLERESELDWFLLSPRSDDATVQEIRLGFLGDELTVMQILDQFGNRTTLQFQQVLRNHDISDSTFVFTPPKGTDLIGSPQ